MTYKFKKSDPSVRKGLQRIAREEVDRARIEIANAPDDPHATVHQLRKRAKRVRGLIRIVRPAFPDYRPENSAMRDAARGLSTVRDRESLIETHDALMQTTGAERRRYAPFRAHLTRQKNRVAAEQDLPTAIELFGHQMENLATRSKDWRLSDKGDAALISGLERTWAKAHEWMKICRKEPSEDNLHEWRKSVKDHWYQAKLLEPMKRSALAPQAKAAGELGEVLGDFNNLILYRDHLNGPETPRINPQVLAELDALAETRQHALQKEAFERGGALFSKDRKALMQDWEAWWRKWRGKSAPKT